MLDYADSLLMRFLRCCHAALLSLLMLSFSRRSMLMLMLMLSIATLAADAADA